MTAGNKASIQIVDIEGSKVLVDEDLARLFGVKTKRLNEQVARNQSRFPSDFVFRLNYRQKKVLVANCDQYRNILKKPALPLVFTEHGALMAAMVLRSRMANEAAVWIARAFVQMRTNLANQQSLATKVSELSDLVEGHDKAIKVVVQTLQDLVDQLPDEHKKASKIGFR